jgi:hypothetical protein
VLYGGVSLLMLLTDPVRVTWKIRCGRIRFAPGHAQAGVLVKPTAPNGFIYLAYPGAIVLAVGPLTLRVGVLRARP